MASLSLAVLLYFLLRPPVAAPKTVTTSMVPTPIVVAGKPMHDRPAVIPVATTVDPNASELEPPSSPAEPLPRANRSGRTTATSVPGRRIVAARKAAMAPTTAAANMDTPQREPQFVYAPDKDGIRAAVDDARAMITECYRGWSKADDTGELTGRVTVRFAITPPDHDDENDDENDDNEDEDDALATLKHVTIDDTQRDLPKNGFLDGCIINAFGTLKFDPPPNATNVTYPIDFTQE